MNMKNSECPDLNITLNICLNTFRSTRAEFRRNELRFGLKNISHIDFFLHWLIFLVGCCRCSQIENSCELFSVSAVINHM